MLWVYDLIPLFLFEFPDFSESWEAFLMIEIQAERNMQAMAVMIVYFECSGASEKCIDAVTMAKIRAK
jgi:hypothetical protein